MLEMVIEKGREFTLDTKAKPVIHFSGGWQYQGMFKQDYYDKKREMKVILCYDCFYVPALDRYAWTKRP